MADRKNIKNQLGKAALVALLPMVVACAGPQHHIASRDDVVKFYKESALHAALGKQKAVDRHRRGAPNGVIFVDKKEVYGAADKLLSDQRSCKQDVDARKTSYKTMEAYREAWVDCEYVSQSVLEAAAQQPTITRWLKDTDAYGPRHTNSFVLRPEEVYVQKGDAVCYDALCIGVGGNLQQISTRFGSVQIADMEKIFSYDPSNARASLAAQGYANFFPTGSNVGIASKYGLNQN